MIYSIALNAVAFLIFLFLYWRKLKEDYIGRQIFSSGFLILAGVVCGILLAGIVNASIWFWTVTLGVAAAMIAGVFKFRLRFFETMDASVPGLLIWLGSYTLSLASRESGLENFLSFTFITILLGLYYTLNSNYKRFSWYRSGRIGFSGLTTLAVFFLGRSTVAVINPDMVSFVRYETALSLMTTGGIAVLLILLTRKHA